jgi:hypothetical protein
MVRSIHAGRDCHRGTEGGLVDGVHCVGREGLAKRVLEVVGHYGATGSPIDPLTLDAAPADDRGGGVRLGAGVP